MTRRVSAWCGVTVDHLYPFCPGLERADRHRSLEIGLPCRTLVDPTGPDICGWCARRWRSIHGGDDG